MSENPSLSAVSTDATIPVRPLGATHTTIPTQPTPLAHRHVGVQPRAEQIDGGLIPRVDMPVIESIAFRMWVPSTRAALQAGIARISGVDGLPVADRDALISAVGDLYDEYARVPDPLQLPYQLLCQRGRINHA
jgi:hypothetical protein